MDRRYTRAARREMALVFGLAVAGIALVLAVVFVPWYDPGMTGALTR
ncbi:hypothetical protein [Krasilnikovia sp. MM14-A1259]